MLFINRPARADQPTSHPLAVQWTGKWTHLVPSPTTNRVDYQPYTCRYEPEDQLEWSLVLEEIKGFIKAESAVAVLHADTNPIILSHR